MPKNPPSRRRALGHGLGALSGVIGSIQRNTLGGFGSIVRSFGSLAHRRAANREPQAANREP